MIGVLLDEMDGDVLHLHPGHVERDPDSPGAGGAEISIQLRALLDRH